MSMVIVLVYFIASMSMYSYALKLFGHATSFSAICACSGLLIIPYLTMLACPSLLLGLQLLGLCLFVEGG